MGCWNETCMLSNLPILDHDAVAATVLARRAGSISNCHSDVACVPAVPLFYGTYDDYGNLENISDADATAELLEKMQGRLYVMIQGRMLPFRPKEPGTEGLIRSVLHSAQHERLRLFDEDDEGNKAYLELHPCYMLKGLADHAISAMKGECGSLESPYDDIGFRCGQVGALKEALQLEDRDPVLEPKARELRSLQIFMDMNRISWHVPSGAGSQEGMGDLQYGWYRRVMAEAERLHSDYDWNEEWACSGMRNGARPLPEADAGNASQSRYIPDIIRRMEERLKGPECLPSHGRATMMQDLQAYAHIWNLWQNFGNVPMDPGTECIEQEWNGFPAGAHREDIWRWFEDYFGLSVAEALMGQKPIEKE